MPALEDKFPRLSRGPAIGVGAALLLALGAAGGAGAVSLTRPPIEMAPLNATPIGKLADGSGIVTVKGKVVERFGDRVIVQDPTGKTMVDMGPASDLSLALGQTVTAQGRYDDGQFHASYLVGSDGRVTATGPIGGPPHGAGGPGRPTHDGPPAGGPGHAARPPLGADGCEAGPDMQAAPPPPASTASPEGMNSSGTK